MGFLEKINSRSFVLVASVLLTVWIGFFLGKISESGAIELTVKILGFYLAYKGAKYQILKS